MPSTIRCFASGFQKQWRSERCGRAPSSGATQSAASLGGSVAISGIATTDEPIHPEPDQPGREGIDHDRSRQCEPCTDKQSDQAERNQNQSQLTDFDSEVESKQDAEQLRRGQTQFQQV